jgi:hypothetical protein
MFSAAPGGSLHVSAAGAGGCIPEEDPMAQTEVGARVVERPLSDSARRRRGRKVAAGAVGAVFVAGALVAVVADRSGGSSSFVPPKSPEDKIASALKGGPAAITAGATLLDWKTDPAGQYPVLREGTNGWSCFPDYAPTPTEDPGCLDASSKAWLDAYYAGTTPKLTAAGISYWPLGTSDPSWTDAAAQAPPPGADWAVDGPHITIIPVDPAEVKSTGAHRHDSGMPMAMWAGTPYAHWHVPTP